MSRLDKLHSNLMKRMSIVIREIWVEVEATVKDYQKEAAQTRSENAKLKQQLRDVLRRNQAHLNGKFTLKHPCWLHFPIYCSLIVKLTDTEA